MSRRNAVCPSCGKKGRAQVLAGPPCGAPLLLPKCPSCGTGMVEDETPPMNRKPNVRPDGTHRRHPS